MKLFKHIKLFFILLFFSILPIALYIMIDSVSHKKVVKIATGSKSGAYYKYAQQYKEELKKDGIELEIVTTKGSVEAQEKLLNSEVDFAFVQGGTEKKGILALANIAYEPIWVFYNRDANITNLNSLRGKRVAVGEEGSGIYPVSTGLLSVLDIDENSTKFSYLSSKKAYEFLVDNKIDAMFYIAASNAKLVNEVMNTPNIDLMDFSDSESFRQYFIKNNEYFQILQLKSDAFDIKEHIPRTTHTLLAKTTILATTKRSSDEMVRLFLKVADRVHREVDIFHEEELFPNVSMLKIEQHRASKHYFKEREHYYEENYSFWVAQSLNSLHNFALKFLLPLVTIFAFIIEVIIPAINLYTRRKINTWYYIINNIDTGVEGLGEKELNEKIRILQKILFEIRETDDIPAIHMGPFYTLQNQIVNILDDLDRRVEILKNCNINNF